MKNLFWLMTTITLVIASYTVLSKAKEIKATVSSDTYHSLNSSHGNETELLDLPTLKEKEIAIVPKPLTEIQDSSLTISNDEKKLLARLVHAEAEGEPFSGKIAVASVVLNRVEHEQFPDSIIEVIYEKNAFEPVQNGSINEPANKEAVKAVEKAIEGKGEGDESLYFYNPDTATSDWIRTRKVIKTIGNHAFAI